MMDKWASAEGGLERTPAVRGMRLFRGGLFLLVLLFVSPLQAALEIEARINPNPVKPGERLSMQIVVSNPADSPSGPLELRIPWPEHLGMNPVVTDGGSCEPYCHSGGHLVWGSGDLGSLPAGGSIAVGFSVTVDTYDAPADGSTIPFEIELFEGGSLARTLSHSVRVQSGRVLGLSLDLLPEAAAPGGLLTYELAYGNAGNAQVGAAVLELPLPTGVEFVSATGNGAHANGVVSWDLGGLPAHGSGRQRVQVRVANDLPGGKLLVARGGLSATVNGQREETLATAASPVYSEPPALRVQAQFGPDPAKPGRLQSGRITVSNPAGSPTGPLKLRLLWPEHLGSSLAVTGGGACVPSCIAGGYLHWELGELPPGGSVTVGFNNEGGVMYGTPDGTVIPFQIELFEGGGLARVFGRALRVQDDRILELSVDPLPDVVAPGGLLAYEVTYGNSGDGEAAADAVLELPLPAGVEFVSATGNGAYANGVVSWDLGGLPAHGSGRQRVQVRVANGLSDGELLAVDRVRLSATVKRQRVAAEAVAVSRVVDAPPPVQLQLAIDPDPVKPDELLEARITVSNPAGSSTGPLRLELLWPEYLGLAPVITGGGDCSLRSCLPGRSIRWEPGSLPPGGSITVGFNVRMAYWHRVPGGAVIPFRVELFEGGSRVRGFGHAVRVQSDRALELSVDPLPAVVAPGELLAYEVTYGNAGNAQVGGAVLELPLPAGVEFVSATGNGAYAGGVVSWDLGGLPAHGGGRQRVQVRVANGLSDGELLVVNAAALSGKVNARAIQAQAVAVSRVRENQPLRLQVEIDPDPVEPGERLDVRIAVSNSSRYPTAPLKLRALRPEYLEGSPTITHGGVCSSSSCDAGSLITWELGSLPGGESVTVSFSEAIIKEVFAASPRLGTVIPFEVELFENDRFASKIGKGVLVHSRSDHDGDGADDLYDDDDDNDGVRDYWEFLNGLDPFFAGDGAEDPDNDGLTNLEEYERDSSPFDGDSDDDGIPDATDAEPRVAAPNGCSGNDVRLKGVIRYLGREEYHCRARGTIRVSGDVRLEPGSKVYYMAPLIQLAPGFRVDGGAELHVIGARGSEIAF